jgi:hypothetical protein
MSSKLHYNKNDHAKRVQKGLLSKLQLLLLSEIPHAASTFVVSLPRKERK